MLQESMVLYFNYHNNVPAPDSDKIIQHYHELNRVQLGSKGLQLLEYFKLLETMNSQAVDELSDFYYQKIESPATLQAVFNELDHQLSEIMARYRSIDIQGRMLRYSTKITLQVEVGKERCQLSNDESPFYSGMDFEDLTLAHYYQVINTLNDITKNEESGIDAFRQVLNKLNIEPQKEVFHESLPVDVLKQVYEQFAEYLSYQSEDEFVKAVNSLERIRYSEMYSNHIAYLFYMLLRIHKVKGRSYVLSELFGVKNKSREQVSEKPILTKIDDFLKSFDENFEEE